MKVGIWDVDDKTGLMSLDGQATFTVYNVDGTISSSTIQYFYKDGDVQAHVSHAAQETIVTRSVATIAIAELERIFRL